MGATEVYFHASRRVVGNPSFAKRDMAVSRSLCTHGIPLPGSS